MAAVEISGEIVTCSSCGRILYYTRDMELTGEK
jgi:predicted  nucleic acid-binding Zn-ribbon protein